MEHREDFTELMREKEMKNKFVVHNYIQMVSVTKDEAVFSLNVREESKNSFGMVHGGAIYAMADNAAGFVVHTDGRHHETRPARCISCAISLMERLKQRRRSVIAATPRRW